MRRGSIDRLKLRIVDLEKFDLQVIQKRWGPEVKSLQTAIEETIASVYGHNTVEYNRYKSAARLDEGPSTIRLGPPIGGYVDYDDRREARQYVAEGIQRSTKLLQQAIRGLEEEIADRGNLPAALGTAATIGAEASTAIDLSKVL